MLKIKELSAGETSLQGEVYGHIQAVPQSTFVATSSLDDNTNEPKTITLNPGAYLFGNWKEIRVISGKILLYPLTEIQF
ncbi:MAG TPA: hypothetical protein VKX31_00395, partial [Brumimicrobium sp.]|nr:hypothetical protein [Brumimicrobium sp.]